MNTKPPTVKRCPTCNVIQIQANTLYNRLSASENKRYRAEGWLIVSWIFFVAVVISGTFLF